MTLHPTQMRSTFACRGQALDAARFLKCCAFMLHNPSTSYQEATSLAQFHLLTSISPTYFKMLRDISPVPRAVPCLLHTGCGARAAHHLKVMSSVALSHTCRALLATHRLWSTGRTSQRQSSGQWCSGCRRWRTWCVHFLVALHRIHPLPSRMHVLQLRQHCAGQYFSRSRIGGTLCVRALAPAPSWSEIKWLIGAVTQTNAHTHKARTHTHIHTHTRTHTCLRGAIIGAVTNKKHTRTHTHTHTCLQGAIGPWDGDLDVPDRLLPQDLVAPEGAVVSERHLKVCTTWLSVCVCVYCMCVCVCSPSCLYS